MSATAVLSPAPRVALVTGGSRRIGRAISLALARAGYAVVVHGSKATLDENLVQDVAAVGGRCAFIGADLSRQADIDAAILGAIAAAGPLSLLVNNASEFEDDTVGGLNPARWDRHFAVNLKAPVFLAQAFAAQAPVGADACIVNITDQRVRKPVPRQFSYTLTKCALDAATVMLAQALAPRVRVNAVAPGPTLPSPRQDPGAFAEQQATLPLQRGPRPEDIADAVVYLAGATSVTGTTITVDGGQHIAWKTPDVWGIEE
ncbi:MAG TPA: SDR family oxidoreductase [Xanthobacteraceae bacterium]|nr:SDR family oxidoreductase [Xanthobacteraceae bacterium]